MKHTIRKNCFETNSSSVHTLIVAHDNTQIPATKLYFDAGEYGWGQDVLTSFIERASYLWTFFLDMNNNRQNLDMTAINQIKDKISNILKKYNIDCEFIIPNNDSWYYIDHCGDWCEYDSEKREYAKETSIFYKMLDDENMLLDYLFNDNSKIYIDNDNDFECMTITYPKGNYDEYYKGN